MTMMTNSHYKHHQEYTHHTVVQTCKSRNYPRLDLDASAEQRVVDSKLSQA